jgi:hypothetical protein
MAGGNAWLAGAALLLAMPAPAVQAKDLTGDYRAAEGPDLAAHLHIGADGKFLYELAYGALDEQAEGRWRLVGGQVQLFTEPRPKPAVFRLDSMDSARDGGFSISVVWPDGRGIAGVDFRIGVEGGEPIAGYTQEYGWTRDMPPDLKPTWIEFSEPYHGTASPRYPITSGRTARIKVTLIPNDMGVVDFNGAVVEADDKGIILHHPRGPLHFVPTAP